MSMLKELYESKLVSAEEAVGHIKSGNRVVLAHCMAEPDVLVEAMVKNHEAYKNVEVTHMVSHGTSGYCSPEYAESFHFKGFFVSGNTRNSVNCGNSDYIPVFQHEIPSLFRNGILPVDVAMVMVSRPDKHGYCYVGVSCDYTMQAMESAKLVIVEANDQVPKTPGRAMIHVRDIDYIVESSRPLRELPPPVTSDIERAIGENCARLIQDGATIQLGIGGLPNAVMQFMKDKKDLGVHSEMISDWIIDMCESGVVNGSKKSLHKGKVIATFIQGTRALYDYIDGNPMIELHPTDYVNHPAIIAENSRMVSINSCIEVDLMGQVVSDSIGSTQYSGVGGQVDFVRGAAMSKDGLGISIIAMPSFTVKRDGTMISKIVPQVAQGAAITTSRNDVDYIVTENGAVRLKGLGLKDRARALIGIAHLEFKGELIQAYEERFQQKF